MKIRTEQMRILEEAARASFESELVEHLHTFAPKLYDVLGDPGMRHAVRNGIARAHQQGFAARQPVTFYLELMCALGAGFDTDPQLPWAAETLADPSVPNEMSRAEQLYQRLVIYLDEVAGENNQHAVRALRQLLEMDDQIVQHQGAITVSAVLQMMKESYPQKFAFVGEPALKVIFQRASMLAAEYALPSDQGPALLAGLQFALGHELCSDPFYPWVAATLNDSLILDGRGKIERLLAKFRVYARHVIAHLKPA